MRPNGESRSLAIGIDPGARTGYAVWCATEARLLYVRTLKAWEALYAVQNMQQAGGLYMVVIEDARLRTWFGAKGREALQGAGAIKRECTLWCEMLGDLGIPYRSIRPQAGATKWSAEQFRRVTGWTGRTSEHARDAALLVYGTRNSCIDNRPGDAAQGSTMSTDADGPVNARVGGRSRVVRRYG